MVSRLIDLAAEASLKDVEKIKFKLNLVPLKLLYNLVDICLHPLRKMMAFAALIQNWPCEIFSASKVETRLLEEELIILASLVQKKQCGKIKLFELNYDNDVFCQFDERVTNAFLKIVTTKESLLSVDRYVSEENSSRCYTDAFNHAKNLLCDDVKTQPIFPSVRSIEPVRYTESNITIEIELVINGNNVSTIKNIFKNQNFTPNSNPSVKIVSSSLHFDYVTTAEIARVLQIVDHNQLYGVDLSFNCLSNYDGNRLQLVCKELKECVALKKVCFAYNSIDFKQCSIITDCFKSLTNLQCIDLSQNKLGHGLVVLFAVGIVSECITAILLSGCGVDKAVMESMIHCKKLSNLKKLTLDQNPSISVSKKKLQLLLLQFKTTLKFLDISSCDLQQTAIHNICLKLTEHQKLNTLVIWPNPGLDTTYIENNLLPILKCLPCLRNIPLLNGI